jgi:hypothetical protein
VVLLYGAETGGGDAASPDGLRGILKTPSSHTLYRAWTDTAAALAPASA